MSTTFALVGPTPDSHDLQLKQFTAGQKALLVPVSTMRSADGLTAAADYTYNSGAASDTVSVSVRVNYDEKKDKTSASLRVTALIRKTVSETGAVTDIPVEAGMFINYSGQHIADSDSMLTLAQMAAALFFKDLTGANGHPTSATIDAIDRRVVSSLYG